MRTRLTIAECFVLIELKQGNPIVDVAQSMGVSSEAVQQIRKNALMKRSGKATRYGLMINGR